MFHNFFKDTNVDFDKSSVINNSNEIFVKAFFIQDEYKCPVCDCSILVKNGHCKKRVKHCIYYTKIIIVECNFQIYKCLNCGHLFQEKNSFSPKGLSFSYESIFAILECIKKPNETFESIAKSFHISRQNVIDIFDRFYTYTPSSMLPSIISFDEKHIGKAITDHKYLFIMLDWKTKKIYDILPSRDKNTLSKYFCSLSRESRHNVSYVTMDMWESYRDIAKKLLPNAKIAVDSFHVMKNINTVMNKIRCTVMQKYNEKTERIEDNSLNYYLLKKFDYFFTKEFDDISNVIKINKIKAKWSKTELLNTLLDIDDKLKEAYTLTSKYREFNKAANIKNCHEELDEIISLYTSSSIDQFNMLGRMLINWKEEIINSFITIEFDNCKRRLSNGPIEGVNSIIEQIKINGKGFTNYDRLKRKIIYVINKDLIIRTENITLKRNKK